jgi:hypothetical protein
MFDALLTHHLQLLPAPHGERALVVRCLARVIAAVARTAASRREESTVLDAIATAAARSIRDGGGEVGAAAFKCFCACVVRLASHPDPQVRRCTIHVLLAVLSSAQETAIMTTAWPALLMYLQDGDESVRLLAVRTVPAVATMLSTSSLVDKVFMTTAAAIEAADGGPLSATGAVAIAGMARVVRALPPRGRDHHMVPFLHRVAHHIAGCGGSAEAAAFKLLVTTAVLDAFEALADCPTIRYEDIQGRVLPALKELRRDADLAAGGILQRRTAATAAAVVAAAAAAKAAASSAIAAWGLVHGGAGASTGDVVGAAAGAAGAATPAGGGSVVSNGASFGSGAAPSPVFPPPPDLCLARADALIRRYSALELQLRPLGDSAGHRTGGSLMDRVRIGLRGRLGLFSDATPAPAPPPAAPTTGAAAAAASGAASG